MKVWLRLILAAAIAAIVLLARRSNGDQAEQHGTPIDDEHEPRTSEPPDDRVGGGSR